jgi:moderate conductance mechanosensitive channel
LRPTEPTSATAEPFRLIPIDSAAAEFWYQRLMAAAIVFVFGWALANLLLAIGVSLDAAQLLAYLIGVALLGLGLDMVWRSPRAAAPEPEAASTPAAVARRRNTGRWTLSLYFLSLWVVWVAGAMNCSGSLP